MKELIKVTCCSCIYLSVNPNILINTMVYTEAYDAVDFYNINQAS